MAASLILTIVSGAVGGNMLGGGAKKLNLGTTLNSVVGAIGGGLGGIALAMFNPPGSAAPLAGMDAASSFDLFGLLSGVAAGGGAGILLTAIVAKAKTMRGGGV